LNLPKKIKSVWSQYPKRRASKYCYRTFESITGEITETPQQKNRLSCYKKCSKKKR